MLPSPHCRSNERISSVVICCDAAVLGEDEIQIGRGEYYVSIKVFDC
jgi:hypothetical protein